MNPLTDDLSDPIEPVALDTRRLARVLLHGLQPDPYRTDVPAAALHVVVDRCDPELRADAARWRRHRAALAAKGTP